MDENEKLYKIVGYSVIALIIAGTIAMFGFLAYHQKQKVGVIYTEFPHIGELQRDDAFEVNGKQVGTVGKIKKLGPSRVIVTINLRRPIEIHEGFRLYIGDVGIMGERMVFLENGAQEAPLVNLADTLAGEYQMGMSDMLGRMPEVREFLDNVITFVRNIQQGTDSARSFIDWLSSAEEKIDRVALSAANATQQWDKDLPEILQKINNLTESFNRDLTNFGGKLPEIFEKTNAIIEKCDTLLTNIAKIKNISANIENFVGKIDGFDVDALNASLVEWQAQILNIAREAHKLQLWIRLGWEE